MRRPLLRQKLVPPPPWGELVDRPRLTAALDAAVAEGRHVALFAGSGYGKTSMAAAWARGRACAWVTLDAEDATLDVFLAYLIAAVARALPGFRTEASDLLGRATEREGAFAALSALLADLDEQVDRPLVLVLDDYHLAASPSLDALVARALKYLPDHVRLVLVARRQPDVGLAALQARQGLRLLDESELAFDVGELARLRPELNPGALSSLRLRTGGWPAAMGMAPGLLDAYLDEQVLVEQPVEIRALLARLALVDAFDAALCENALGEPLTEARRTRLLDHRLMLATDDERWVLPPLLRDLLRRRFMAEVPRAERQIVLARIGDWYFDQGQASTALRFWVDAGEVGVAADRLEFVAEDWLAHGRGESLAAGLAALAEAGEAGRAAAGRPALLSAQGELHRRWGDFERAEQLLGEAAAGFDAGSPGRALARLRQAQTAASRGQTALARERLAEAAGGTDAETMGPAGDRHRLDRLIVEGGLALLEGDTPQALIRYETALRLGQRLNDRYAEARAIHNLGVCHTRLGDFASALAHYDAALATPVEDGTPVVWMTPINRALVLTYLGRPAEGLKAAEAALDLVRRYRLGREEGYALRILGLARQRLGELDQAHEAYAAAERLARRTNDTLGLAYSLNFQAERAALAGDVPEASRLAAEVAAQLGGRERVAAVSEFAAVAARVDILEGHTADARVLVEALVARAAAQGSQALAAEATQLEGLLAAREAGTAPTRPVAAAAAAGAFELRVRCFGGLRVSRETGEVGEREWQTARAKHLLAYLLHTPEGATKPQLFEAIYPQEEVTDASMNMTMMRLRKALEPGLEKGRPSRFVLRADGRYSFNGQANVEVDTQVFDALLRQARTATSPEEEAALLTRALALYTGECLPECDQAWAIALRQRYAAKATGAARRLIALYDVTDPGLALATLHRALEIEPLSEEWNRELILRHLEAGDRHLAKQHHTLVAKRWRDQLDSDPPPDLTALVAGA